MIKHSMNYPGNIRILSLIMGIPLVLLIVTLGVIHGETVQKGGLQILKSQVTSTAKFYPYSANGVKMEVIAVKASDGTVRTAFNTCQVCYDSGRGYYTQQGNELVCNNCGNRFWIDKVEKIKYGCNPIPILPENKKDDGKYITISKDFLVKYSDYFKNWKR
jgi:hypothetical protein